VTGGLPAFARTPLTNSHLITHGGAFIVQVPEQEQEVADVT